MLKTTTPALVILNLLINTLLISCVLAEDPPLGPVLYFSNGGSVAGELVDSTDPKNLKFQSPAFTSPFEFAQISVKSLVWPAAKTASVPTGEYGFELAGGDLVYGSLIEMTDEMVTIEALRLGKVRFARSQLRGMSRSLGGSNVVYLGPNGLTGWREPPQTVATNLRPAIRIANRAGGVKPETKTQPTKPGWRDESGHMVSDVPGASIIGDLKLPARSIVEIELSWKAKPNFLLALGVDSDGDAQQAFRFEVWDGQLIVTRELDEEADLAQIAKLPPGPGRLQLQVLLDQEAGSIYVLSPDGEAPIKLTVSGPTSRAFEGIRLDNLQGDIRLERLRISRWNGALTVTSQRGQDRILLTDGSTIDGVSVRYEPKINSFLIHQGTSTTEIAAARVSGVTLDRMPIGPTRVLRVFYHDGTRISGSLSKVEQGQLVLNVPGFGGEMRLTQDGLRSLDFLHEENPTELVVDLTGTLELDRTNMRGRLVDGQETPGSSCLKWQPLGSSTSSALRQGVSGRVIYHETAPKLAKPLTTNRPMPVAPLPLVQRVLNGFTGGTPNAPPLPTKPVRRAIYLIDGDVIPCEVTKIDENGVWFTTELSSSTFVPHEKVKAIELANALTTQVQLDASKRDRLLTLPRMQRENPPTHMIRSRNGDYLRGRLVGLDDKTLKLEVRLEVKDVPRDRVSRIIWLHPEQLDPTMKIAPKTDHTQTKVQAVKSDGIRATFMAKQVSERTLEGISDVLGDCKVGLGEVDQILIGDAIGKSVEQLAYQQLWKLKKAPDPKTVSVDGASTPGGRVAGTESPLVGKPAPDFKLDLLDGKPFKLSEQKGHIIVLDFWATWCGPCLQAMPQVERVAKEFKDRDVLLIAVNLQESPKQIKSMLERHKLDPVVALDIDGVVAERYAANAIPQTVIIDKEGKITHLFIGGGPRLGDQLRDALTSVITPAAPAVP